MSLEAAGGDYVVREPSSVVCSNTCTFSVMNSGNLFAWGTGCLGLASDEDAVVVMIQTKTRIPRHVVMNVSCFQKMIVLVSTMKYIYT